MFYRPTSHHLFSDIVLFYQSERNVTFKIEAGARLCRSILNSNISYPEMAKIKTNPKKSRPVNPYIEYPDQLLIVDIIITPN